MGLWCQHASQNQKTGFDWQCQCQLTGLVWSSCSEGGRVISCCSNQLEFSLCQAVFCARQSFLDGQRTLLWERGRSAAVISATPL